MMVSMMVRVMKMAIKPLAILIILGLVWTAYIQWKIYSAEDMTLGVEPADVCIVLGAALWNDKPSPALRERLDVAVELYEEGHCHYVIATGGLDNNGATISESEGMIRYLVDEGIPQTNMRSESEARSTYENLLFSRTIMEQEKWHSAIIVTHSYHGARAHDIAQFLDYEQPKMSVMDSQVMFMPYHKARETLAYTKWTLDKWLLRH
ncbi:MAG: YdcF family protein [Paenibacillaceae bacterium]